jgi:hypothetical protein
VAFCLLAAGPAQAQITIGRGNLPQRYGDSLRQKYNVDTAGVNVLAPGGPHAWVFDTAAFTGALRWYVIVDPSLAPFQTDFPSANYVDHTIPDDSTVSTYDYMRLEDDSLNLLGNAVVSSDTSYVRVFEARYRMLVLPLALDSAWTTATSWYVPIVGESIEMLCERRSRMSVDGWGTAQIPMGTFDCLRLDCYDTMVNTTYVGGTPVYSDTSGHRSYTWWTREHGMVAATTGPLNDTGHVFTKSDCYWVLVGRTAGAIAEHPTPPARSELPLPGVIAGSVVVRGREAGRFEILDVTGRSVAVQPGSSFGAGLPAGVYLVRGQAGERPQRVVKVR